MPPERHSLTRQQLYDLVWTKPMEQLGCELGLSGRGLGKLCARMVIPVPYRGYWARKAAGHPMIKTHLPKARPEYPAEHTFDIPSDPLPESVTAEPEAAIVVSATLIEPHPLIAATEQTLRALHPSPKILLVCTDKAILEVRVSEPQLNRALRIMDTILKTAIARGEEIEICDAARAYRHKGYVHSTPREHFFSTWVCRDGDAIRIHLEQDQQQVGLPDPPPPPEPSQPKGRRPYQAPWRPPPPPRYEWRAVSDLRLRVDFHYTGQSFQQNWNSTEKRPLEGQLNRFFRELDKIFACLRLQRIDREDKQRAAEEAQRHAEEQRQRVLAERRRVHDLHSRLRDWSAALRMRDFIGTVEAEAITRQGTIVPDSDLARWLTWAREYGEFLRTDAVSTLPELRPLADPPPRPQAEQPNYSGSSPTFWETQHWWQSG